MDANITLNHSMENAPMIVVNSLLSISVELSLLMIMSSKNTKCLPSLSCTYSNSQRQEPLVNNQTMYKNPNSGRGFASTPGKGYFNIQESPIWHDEKELNAVFKLLSHTRELTVKLKFLCPLFLDTVW